MLLYHIILFTLQYFTMYCKNTNTLLQDVPTVALPSIVWPTTVKVGFSGRFPAKKERKDCQILVRVCLSLYTGLWGITRNLIYLYF